MWFHCTMVHRPATGLMGVRSRYGLARRDMAITIVRNLIRPIADAQRRRRPAQGRTMQQET